MKLFRSFLLPGLSVSITFLILWYANLPVQVAVPSDQQVEQEAQDGGYRLIDVTALRILYQSNREKLLLVDTRQEWEYRAGHIAGSVNFPLEPTWLARWQKKRELKTFLGPDKNKTIVFY